MCLAADIRRIGRLQPGLEQSSPSATDIRNGRLANRLFPTWFKCLLRRPSLVGRYRKRHAAGFYRKPPRFGTFLPPERDLRTADSVRVCSWISWVRSLPYQSCTRLRCMRAFELHIISSNGRLETLGSTLNLHRLPYARVITWPTIGSRKYGEAPIFPLYIGY